MPLKNAACIATSVFALSLAMAMAPQAQAQSAITPMPPTRTVDENGVDLINWTFTYQVAPIHLGPPDQNPLKLSIFLPTEGDNFTSNIRIADPTWVTSTNVTASVGDQSWLFLGGGGVSDPGASIIVDTYSAEIHARDGTVFLFQFPSYYVPGTQGPLNFCATKITKPDGEIFTFYNEDSAPLCRTRSIVSNRGYQVHYDYPSGGFQTKRSKVTIINNAYEYCAPTATSCALSTTWPSISIVNSGTAISYTDHAGQAWVLGSNGLLGPGETTPSIKWITQTYVTPAPYPWSVTWRVTSVVRGANTWNYSYPSSDSLLGGDGYQLISVQDPLGNTTRYRRTPAISGGDPDTGEYSLPNLLSKSADEISRVTSYSYVPNGTLLTKISLPEGNSQNATFDYAGNVLARVVKSKPGSGLADLTMTYTYGSWNDRPTSVTDPRGNTTDYTYDPVHGGVLTETGPAPTPGAVRPVKRYAYSQHYAWVKNSSGSYVQAATPIWLLDSEKTCRTSATVSGGCAAGTSDEVTTSYDYGPNAGPNNLWLRGKVITADGVSLRACYGYDPVGNKIWETSPRTGLTSCP